MWQIAEVDRLHVKKIHLVGCSNIDIIDYRYVNLYCSVSRFVRAQRFAGRPTYSLAAQMNETCACAL
jgi:hypothetical protein